jgi:hypothetical protein
MSAWMLAAEGVLSLTTPVSMATLAYIGAVLGRLLTPRLVSSSGELTSGNHDPATVSEAVAPAGEGQSLH